MGSIVSSRRFRFAAIASLAAMAVAVALADTPWGIAVAVGTTLALLGWTASLHRAATPPPARADADDARLANISHRLVTDHPVSGLPVREILLAQMRADRAGLLGALGFADVDRLTAFDPALGDALLAALIARLRSMLPTGRFAAQVDRGHVGLWFSSTDEAAARAELDAIVYALGEQVDVAGQRIVPQVNVRLARFEGGDNPDAGAFLARTLASFTLPAAAVADPERPSADYAELARERYALEQDLRQAIARRQLRLCLQPLVDAGRGCVSGAEALLRWDHPERGAIPPARFIPIMEAMGLASEIGLWVLNAAVREAQGWAAQGLGQLRVAVNVSSLQLEREDLPLLVQRTLQRHEVGAGALELELTESVATSDADHCRRVFQQLRAMGVKLAVDDFGTGYSGFASLRALAFDKIKIDRSFVTDVDRRPDSQAICQSIAALGRGLGMRVLAEGVERREEYEWLRRHGVRHFQGYYFGRPMDATAFVACARDAGRLEALLRLDNGPARIEERLRA